MPYYDGYDENRDASPQEYDNRYVSYDNRGPRWRGRESHAMWARDHSIDERGQIQGPFPYVPHSLAHVYQGIHDQKVYQYRDRVMRDSVDLSLGGLNLMQSYRPGGSAALESGKYQQAAGLQMQRASMIQPMDLMGDYRRYIGERERRKREIAFRQNLYGGIGAAIGSFWAPQYAMVAQNHFNQASQLYTEQEQPAYQASTSQNVPNPQGQGGEQTRASQGPQGESSLPAGQGPALEQPDPYGDQSQGAGGGPMGGMPTGALPSTSDGSDGGGGPAPLQSDPYEEGGPSSGGGDGQDGQMAGGGGATPAYMPPGADGDFSSTARARHAAQSTPYYLQAPIDEAMATSYEQDPFYDHLNAEIDYQMYIRRAQ